MSNTHCYHDGGDLSWDDRSLCSDFNEGLDIASDLHREWHKRHSQFHTVYTIGYCDSLTTGKEASAQEGFNDGFKQSMLVGYNWGLVRGVTSVLACLPDSLKEKLVKTIEMSEKFQNLYELVHCISTKDALSVFNDEIMACESEEQSKYLEGISNVSIVPYEIPSCIQLGRYSREFESLLESSEISVHLGAE